MAPKQQESQKKIDAQLVHIAKCLHEVYSNKSTDEYKMAGDITKSKYYDNIDIMVADLSSLKGFPQSQATDINRLFNMLHRPIFKSMVKEFMVSPNERNSSFCCYFTLGYRTLIGELSRIYSSTEATETGIKYNPTKIKTKDDHYDLINILGQNLESKINEDIKKHTKALKSIDPITESYYRNILSTIYTEEYDEMMLKKELDRFYSEEDETDADMGDSADTSDVEDASSVDTEQEGCDDCAGTIKQEGMIAGAMETISGWLGPVTTGLNILKSIMTTIHKFIDGVNPLAEMNFLFMKSYEKKIERFEDVSDEYLATKNAYEEYMKLPTTSRSMKTESRYRKNMEKYNIKMKNLEAEIEHYNSRAKKDSDVKSDTTAKKTPEPFKFPFKKKEPETKPEPKSEPREEKRDDDKTEPKPQSKLPSDFDF